MNQPQSQLKTSGFETKRWDLHDPVNAPALCFEIAEQMAEGLNSMVASAAKNGVVVKAVRVLWIEDTDDGHTSGRFRVLAQGVSQ